MAQGQPCLSATWQDVSGAEPTASKQHKDIVEEMHKKTLWFVHISASTTHFKREVIVEGDSLFEVTELLFSKQHFLSVKQNTHTNTNTHTHTHRQPWPTGKCLLAEPSRQLGICTLEIKL